MVSVLSNILASTFIHFIQNVSQTFSEIIIQMLSFLTSAACTLYINLNSSKSYHQVGFEQLHFVKYVPDHSKWDMCVGCVCHGIWSLNSKYPMILHYYSI